MNAKFNSRIIKLTWVIIFLFGAFCNGFSQEYRVRFAMIGNSITYGATLDNPSEECYSAQLSNMLAEVYGDTCEIMNYGVSARTMMRNAEKPIWIEPEFDAAIKYVPHVCLIMLGTNDSKPYRWTNWGDEFDDDYMAMVDTFRLRNPDVKFIVCLPPPIWPEHTYGNTFETRHNDSVLVNNVNPIIENLAKETGALLIDFHTPFMDSVHLFPDFLHPNAEASKQMAKLLFDSIIEDSIVEQVIPALAYVSYFEQVEKNVLDGDSITLKWESIYAKNAHINDQEVDVSGTMKVIAKEGDIYSLEVTGDTNINKLELTINTYVPEKMGLAITSSTDTYVTGKALTFHVAFKDQLGRLIDENTKGITWEVIEGSGEFSNQTDTSTTFIPGADKNTTIQASYEEISQQKSFIVDTALTSSLRINAIHDLEVYPNPTNGNAFIKIRNTNNEDVQVVVADDTGKQLIYDRFVSKGDNEVLFKLNMSSLNKGIYFYTVSYGNNSKSGKLIKY